MSETTSPEAPRVLLYELRRENGDLILITPDFAQARARKRITDYIAEAYYVRLDSQEGTR